MTGDTRQPYPGLRPFQRDETDIFFGRNRYIDQMTNRLREHRFLAVTGTSGSGKSSIVKTGLLSALELGFLDHAGGNWRIIDMRPGMKPMDTLARALFRALDEDASTHDVEVTRAALERGPKSLGEYLQRFSGGFKDSLLVLVDQFEEIFRFAQGSSVGEAEAFVDLLLGSAMQRDIPIYVVLTMRSDFLGDCARFYGLPEMINLGQFLTPRMSRSEYSEAIEEPARVFGGSVDRSVTARLLNDMVDVPDQLCLVQHVMMMMWRRAETRNKAAPNIQLGDYLAVGGLVGVEGSQGALSNHADEVYAALPSGEHRYAAKRMLQRLTEGAGRESDVRRPSSFKELLGVADATPETLRSVIEAFRAPQNSFLMPPVPTPIDENTIIDISHESLIRQWTRLKGWIAEEFDSQEIYKRLEETGRRWKAGRAGLLTDPDLTQALSWHEREQPTATWASRYASAYATAMEFLEASREAALQAEAASQRALVWRWVARGAAVVVPLLLLGLVLYLQSLTTQRNEIAEKNKEIQKQAAEVSEWQSRAYKGQFTHLLRKADERLRAESTDEARSYALAARRLITEAGEEKLDLNDFSNILAETLLLGQSEQALSASAATKTVKASFTPDGKRIVWTEDGPGKGLMVSDAANGRLLSRQRRTASEVRQLIISSDGSHAALVAQRGDAELYLVKGESPSSYRDVYSPNDLQSLAFGKSGDKLFLAAVDYHGDVFAWRFNADGTSIKREPLLRRELPMEGQRVKHGFVISCLESQCVWAEPDGTTYSAELNPNSGWVRHGKDKITEWSGTGISPFLGLIAPKGSTESRILAFSQKGLSLWAIDAKAGTLKLSKLWSQPGYSFLAGIGLDADRNITFLYKPDEYTKTWGVAVTTPEGFSNNGEIKETKYQAEFPKPNVADFSLATKSIVFSMPSSAGGVTLRRATYRPPDSTPRECVRNCDEFTWLGEIDRGLVGLSKGELHVFQPDGDLPQAKDPLVPSISRAITDKLAGQSEPTAQRLPDNVRILANVLDAARNRVLTLVAAPSTPEHERLSKLKTGERPHDHLLAAVFLAAFDLTTGAVQGYPILVTTKEAASAPIGTANFALVGTYRASDRNDPATFGVLVTVGADGSIAAVLDPTLADTRDIRVGGKSGVLRREGNRIRVDDDKAHAVRKRRDIQLNSNSGILIDFGFLDDGRAAYVAYNSGRIDIWNLIDDQAAPVTIDARTKIGGMAWSADQQTVHVYEADLVKSFNHQGRVIWRQAFGNSVRALVPLVGGKLFTVVGNRYYVFPPADPIVDADRLAIVAEAGTQRWFSRSDQEIVANWTLPSSKTAEHTKTARVSICRAQNDSAMMSTYEEECARIVDDSGLSPNVKAIAISQHAYSALERHWPSVRGAAPLAFAMARAADDDPIGTALVAHELTKRRDRTSGFTDNLEDGGNCGVERFRVARTLYLLAMQKGRIVSPHHVALEFKCETRSGAELASVVNVLRQEADSGNALAHALLGYELEESARDDTASLRQALFRYGIASRLLFDARAKRQSTDSRLPDQNILDDIEDLVGARRVELAKRLPQEDVVKAWGEVDSAVKAIHKLAPKHIPAAGGGSVQTGYARLQMLEALAAPDIATRIANGQQLLDNATGKKLSRELSELAIRAQYGLVRQAVAKAGVQNSDARSRILLEFLSRVSLSEDRSTRTTVYADAVNALTRRLIETRRETALPVSALQQLVDFIAQQAGVELQISSGERATLFGSLSAAAGDLGDDALATRLAIAMLETAEDLDRNAENAAILHQAQARVLELVPNAEKARLFEPEFAIVGWNYIDWMNSYDRLKLPNETVDKLVREGLQAHENYVASLGDKATAARWERLSLARNAAGRLADRLGWREVAAEHHQRDAEIGRKVLAMRKDGSAELATSWRNLAIAQENQASALVKLGKFEDAIRISEQRIESWGKAHAFKHHDGLLSLFDAKRHHYGHIVANKDLVAGTIGVLSAYHSLTGAEAQAMGATQLKHGLRLGIVLGRLARIAAGNENTPDRCDLLASHDSDPLSVGPGADYALMDVNAAVVACRSAVERTGSRRFRYQLARAYNRRDGDSSPEVSREFRALTDAGYPMAFNNYAVLASRDKTKSADAYLEFFNRTAHCCAKAAALYLLKQRGNHDPAKVNDAALKFLTWGAQLGSPSALEELASLVLKGEFRSNSVPSPAAKSAEAFGYYHLRLAERMYREGGSDRLYERQEDVAGAARTKTAAMQLRSKLAPSVAADLDSKAAAWTFKRFDAAPEWMVPPAVAANWAGAVPKSFNIQAAEDALEGRATRLVNVMDWADTPQGYDYWDREDDELIAGRPLTPAAAAILREWIRIVRQR